MARHRDMDLSCQGGPSALDSLLEDILGQAASDLDLAQDFSGVIITADDFQGDGAAWFNFGPGLASDTRPILQLFCHHANFCRPGRQTRTILPEREIWEQTWSPTDEATFEPREFSATRSGQFLNHNLLTARDIVRGDLARAGIGADRVEAFSALWAVTVDGRLERDGLQGYDLTTRRGLFSRHFSTAGILLPDHWQIYQALWDGGLAGWREVLAVTDRMPLFRPAAGA